MGSKSSPWQTPTCPPRSAALHCRHAGEPARLIRLKHMLLQPSCSLTAGQAVLSVKHGCPAPRRHLFTGHEAPMSAECCSGGWGCSNSVR